MTPAPITLKLADDAIGYPRLVELTEILTTGAVLRVEQPTPTGLDSEPKYPTRRSVRNHSSVITFATQVRQQLAEEVAAGTTFVLGSELPMAWQKPGSGVFPSPMGCVEKSTSTPTAPVVRIIVDASDGGAKSLNARITKTTVDESDPSIPSYLSNQVIAATLLAAGPDARYSLTDVKAAFHNVALDPSNYRFSVVHFEDVWYCQSRLGFGYRSSPDIFEVVMGAFDWIERTQRCLNILRIVDDILNVDPAPVAAANASLMRADMIRYGIPIAAEKNVNQVSIVKFNGLEWNAINQSVTIPTPKKEDIRRNITRVLSQHPPSLTSVESIVGKLQAVTCVLPSGKAHLQHLYRNLSISKLKAPGRGRSAQFVVSRNTRAELHWWLLNLAQVIPRPLSALAAELQPAKDAIRVFTDASGLGLGVYVETTGAWNYMRIPADFEVNPDTHSDTVTAVGSTLIEVAAIVFAIMTFTEVWQDQNVTIHTDNTGAAGVFQRRHSSSAAIGSMLTYAVDLCTLHNINVHVMWIPGVSNVIADPISRGNFAAFRLAAPGAAPYPTPCMGSPFNFLQ